MYSTRCIREDVAPLVLSMLLRRGQIRLPPQGEVLLSSTQPHRLARVLAAAHGRGVPTRPLQPTPSQPPNRRGLSLLKDMPGFGSEPVAASVLHIVALAAGPSQQCDGNGGQSILSLPLTLSDVASLYRAKHRERLPSSPSNGAAARDGAGRALLLEGKRVQRTQRDSFDLYCQPASKDLMVVDTLADPAVDERLWEALLVAECTLHPGGSLLALSPRAFSPRMRGFLRWRFHSSHCAAAADGASHYALCTSLAADFGAASVRRDDFPGFLPATKKRARKWNPYRREAARKFVVSVRPGFTNAPHTKDALLRNVAREKERDDQLRDADDAFFAVAHSMVEKGTHYSRPND